MYTHTHPDTHTHTLTHTQIHTHLVAHDRDFDNMYERLKELQGQLAAAKTDLETRVTELENER
jgi:hypothetical protein